MMAEGRKKKEKQWDGEVLKSQLIHTGNVKD